MGILEGKKGLVLGVANQKSIAWGIAKACHQEGAQLGFTYLNEALLKRVRPLAESVGSELVVKCDVQSDQEVEAAFSEVAKAWGDIDFVVHSVAYAQADDLTCRFHEISRDGFSLALDISAYSLIAVSRAAKSLLKPGASILTLSYLGSVSVVPNYRLMGTAKAALESCVRELAVDFGQDGIRVNAISAGPIKTLAASGIGSFRTLLSRFEERAPLRRLVTTEDVGKAGLYLVSDLASAVTGEVHYVDAGFNVTAM